MPSNAQAIADLETARDTLHQQYGATGDNRFVTAANQVNTEIKAIVLQNLNDADYVPNTDAFKGVTAAAQSFLGLLNDLKTAFAAVAGLAGIIDKVIGYIK